MENGQWKIAGHFVPDLYDCGLERYLSALCGSHMDNIIEAKSFRYAVRIVRLYQYLCRNKNEYILSKQLLRSGTSIGANVAEAQQAQSKADFISKLSIALKEASETRYGLRLLRATDYLTDKEAASIMAECEEMERILIAIIRSNKNRVRVSRPTFSILNS